VDSTAFTLILISNVFRGSCQLKILEDINLELTAEQVFAWLKIGK
jgi:hypothetical protein